MSDFENLKCLHRLVRNGYPTPIPSVEEQKLIVAKIDELMAFGDRLKADLAIARQHQATLADPLIESALEAA